MNGGWDGMVVGVVGESERNQGGEYGRKRAEDAVREGERAGVGNGWLLRSAEKRLGSCMCCMVMGGMSSMVEMWCYEGRRRQIREDDE